MSQGADERQPLLNGSVAPSAATQVVASDEIPSNVVGWEGPEDPENPRNWTTKVKSSIVVILTAITILS